MINSVVIVGRVGRDPQVARVGENRIPRARFSVACNEKRKVNGELRDRVHWVSCVAFDRTAQFCEQYVTRGARVAIQGSLSYYDWEDQSGARRSKLEVAVSRIELLDWPENRDRGR